MSESFVLASLLAIIGGFLDSYTYLLRGRVFANAQTGNIVMLGINIAQMNFQKSLYYLIPIISFSFGIITAEFIKSKYKFASAVHWRQIVAGAEAIMLLIVSFIPVGKYDFAANIIISFVCAMQAESFRKVNGNAYATTMCTGNLRSGTELLYRHFKFRDINEFEKGIQYFGVILFFIIGAGFGNFFIEWFNEWAVLVCCFLLILSIILMAVNDN